MAHIIAISNHKGGVAKTTTCLSLGACLAEMGRRTLVVDLDPQANLTLAAGLDPDALDWSVADVLSPPEEQRGPKNGSSAASPCTHPTAVQGLDILPADVGLARTERVLAEHPDGVDAMTTALSAWQSEYDYILLDCPPSLGRLTVTALAAAHTVLIPVQCEYFAAQGLRRMRELSATLRRNGRSERDDYLLITMYDKRNRISKGVLRQLRANFSEQLFETVIGIDTKLRECPAAGEPIVTYAPRTRASRQYRKLALEFEARVQ